MQFFTDYTNLILVIIASVSGILLVWPTLARRNYNLSVQQAIQLINRRHAVVIDLRSDDEYARGHLPQARHLAFEILQNKSPQMSARLGKNKRVPVLLVCQKGQRSQRAKALIEQAGYAEVFTLHGGLNAWQQAGMPMVMQQRADAKAG